MSEPKRLPPSDEVVTYAAALRVKEDPARLRAAVKAINEKFKLRP